MKKIYLIFNIIILVIISILLFNNMKTSSTAYITYFLLLLSLILNIIIFSFGSKTKIKNLKTHKKLNLQNKISDFLKVLESSNINETLLKETYRKTIQLFESLIIEKETNSVIMEHFKNLVDNEIKRSLRYKSKFSLIIIKISNTAHFKEKSYKILKQVKILSKYLLRDMDIIGRYSQDALIFLLPETGIKGANTVGERTLNLLPTVNKQHIVDGEIKLSIGISTFPYNGKYYDVLLQNAQKNLTQAEMLGGNQVIFNVEEV